MVSSTKFDTLLKQSSHESGGSLNASILGSDVNLQTSLGVNGQLFAFVNGGSETAIVWSSIFVIGIILESRVSTAELIRGKQTYLWIIDMFFGSVATKSLRSNLKLVGGIAKSDE